MASSECEDAARRSIKEPSGCEDAEYPCVKRLRHRRLLSFLHTQGFHGTYDALLRETDAHFCLGRLQQHIKQGQWRYAFAYLTKHLPPYCGRSYRAQVLLEFLYIHHGIAHVVAGNENKYLHHKYISQVDLRLCDTTLSILALSPDQLRIHTFRASMDSEKVRKKAAFLVDNLVHVTPELRCSLYLPGASIMPRDVLSLASSSCHRRHLKRPGPQPRKTKSIFRALKRQQYIMDYVFNSKIVSLDVAKDRLSDMIDESLLGCLREGYRLSRLPPSGKEGSQAMFGAFTIPAKNSGILSAVDVRWPICVQYLANVGFYARAPGAPSSQTMLGSLTDQAKTSEVSSWTNAGTGKLSEAGCYTECACQDFSGRKDPSDELTTVEEDPDPKRKDLGKQVW